MGKEFKRQITIEYNWWREDGKNIHPNHLESLDNHAKFRALEQIELGYTSGELYSENKSGKIIFRGNWSLTTKTL